MKLNLFRTLSLSIIRRFSLYTQQWYMSYSSVDSLRAESGWNYDIHHCWVYSEKLMMMDKGIVRNILEFHSKNKFEKLVYPVGFIVSILFQVLSKNSLSKHPCFVTTVRPSTTKGVLVQLCAHRANGMQWHSYDFQPRNATSQYLIPFFSSHCRTVTV
jgi:hypothetical protein